MGSLFSFLLLCCALPLLGKEPPLSIQLVSSVTSVQPGVPFYLGLALHHAPGYHTYWQHPGIVGVATGIEWEKLPKGFQVEPITWPEPEHVTMFQIHCQGYERDVVLPIKVTPPQKLPASFTFTGKAAWMCCNRECNPGFADLSLTLTTHPEAQPAHQPQWHSVIQAELARAPQTSSAWQTSVNHVGKNLTLKLKPVAGAVPLNARQVKRLRYFTLDGFVDSDKPQLFTLAEQGTLQVTLTLADYTPGGKPKQLRGLLLLDKGSWETSRSFRALQFEVPL